MRILYIDIDSLRPDHLGCYGYHRDTSPNIDRLAAEGSRFDNVYISDAPCLPSRTALWSGRAGFRTGVVGHGGTAAQPFVEGSERGFRDLFGRTSWMSVLRRLGFHTATISSFGERHSAWHWYAGFNEIHNPGKGGLERADEVNELALPWLAHHAREDHWFLHVNYWDPHTPYRTPLSFGEPFAEEPLPAWLTEEAWQRAWNGFGPHSAREPHGYGSEASYRDYPRLPAQLDSLANAKRWIDGYDTGIRYADDHIGQLLNALADAGVLEETAIIVSADHGENQGELNVWGDHQTADQFTCRIPLIIRWPEEGVLPAVDEGLHYHYDWAATLIALLGGKVPENWDGRQFLGDGGMVARPYVITSQMAWACQRGVRFDHYLCLRTYHDGYKDLARVMLFDLEADPHEERNLAVAELAPSRDGDLPTRPTGVTLLVERAMGMLADWYEQMALTSGQDVDPMMTVLREGGPFHTRGELPGYLERLRATGRAHHAEDLARVHGLV